MEMMQHAVYWVEIPVTDFERARAFYEKIFDYEMPELMMGPNRMGILLYNQQNGGIGAAIVHGNEYVPTPQGAKVYLNGGSDLNEVLHRVEMAGGKVVLEKKMITPELGYYGSFEDTEGNVVHLHSIN